MWKRAVAIGALALAVTATSALPTFAEQGKARRPASAAKNRSVKPVKQATSSKAAKTRAARVKASKAKASKAKASKAKRQKKAERVPQDPSQMNDAQRARLRSMLPAGMTIEQAASGFQNHGAFLAAVNAAHLHRVSFVQLKHLMVNQGMTLGQALKSLRPDLGDLDDRGNPRR